MMRQILEDVPPSVHTFIFRQNLDHDSMILCSGLWWFLFCIYIFQHNIIHDIPIPYLTHHSLTICQSTSVVLFLPIYYFFSIYTFPFQWNHFYKFKHLTICLFMIILCYVTKYIKHFVLWKWSCMYSIYENCVVQQCCLEGTLK